MRIRRVVALALTGALALAACSSSSNSSGGGSGSKLALVGYSTPKPVYDALTKAFAGTPAGKGTSWSESFGASGDQSRAVDSGLKADYVAFSLETDMDRLVKDGKVAKTWDAGPTKGFVSDSVVVLVVRKGNPKHITSWEDLVRPGIKVVTPNPFSSGSARWNILAAYGHVLADGGTESEANAYLKKLFANIVTQPASGREATTTFTSGTGDVLLSYENEAIFARQNGQAVDYVVPDDTLLIQNPAAVTVGAPAAAKSFLTYALSKAGQEVFRSNGYRPVLAGTTGDVKGANDPSDPFPTPSKLFEIGKLGGWDTVTTKFFDPKSGIITLIEEKKGVPVGK